MKTKVKRSPTKKDMQKELEMFRKLSMHMVANKLFLEYKMASGVMPVEPEQFVEECIKDNFPKLKQNIKDGIWHYFLSNLVISAKRAKK